MIIDVVYNHIGTSGIKAFDAFGPYFTDRHETPWGRAINYDQDGAARSVSGCCRAPTGWIRDFGIDGLRLDAIHSIYDSSPEHIVAAVARRVHEERSDALVIGELGLADPREHGAPACDALWIDRFHHALRAALTGEREGYYADFGRVEQLADTYLQRQPERVVVYSQNHDQVGNRAFGDRLPPELQPLAAFCTLLSPFLPLLFMGEEYGERAPFQFFSDHIDKRIATRRGRGAAGSSQRSRSSPRRRSQIPRIQPRSSAPSWSVSATPRSRGSTSSCWRCAASCPSEQWTGSAPTNSSEC